MRIKKTAIRIATDLQKTMMRHAIILLRIIVVIFLLFLLSKRVERENKSSNDSGRRLRKKSLREKKKSDNKQMNLSFYKKSKFHFHICLSLVWMEITTTGNFLYAWKKTTRDDNYCKNVWRKLFVSPASSVGRAWDS